MNGDTSERPDPGTGLEAGPESVYRQVAEELQGMAERGDILHARLMHNELRLVLRPEAVQRLRSTAKIAGFGFTDWDMLAFRSAPPNPQWLPRKGSPDTPDSTVADRPPLPALKDAQTAEVEQRILAAAVKDLHSADSLCPAVRKRDGVITGRCVLPAGHPEGEHSLHEPRDETPLPGEVPGMPGLPFGLRGVITGRFNSSVPNSEQLQRAADRHHGRRRTEHATASTASETRRWSEMSEVFGSATDPEKQDRKQSLATSFSSAYGGEARTVETQPVPPAEGPCPECGKPRMQRRATCGQPKCVDDHQRAVWREQVRRRRKEGRLK